MMMTTDLSQFWDTDRVLRNPHKGWYHHYFDNGITHYMPERDEDLERFPGLNHLYLRLPWSDLEPEQGVFQWALIDDVIRKWVAKGYTISFRITCKETGTVYATPEWVRVLGCQGRFIDSFCSKGDWRPEYGDPVFLQALDAFHEAFAAHYDGQPWVEYVDIGSYGEWGEGHNSATDRLQLPFEVLKQHIDIHKRHYRKSLLAVSDDLPYEGVTADDSRLMLDYLVESGITFRDDSILVRYYMDVYPDSHSVRSPEYFARVAGDRPTILEIQHYGMCTGDADPTWSGANGSVRGAATLEGAMELMRATWIGYHGDARVFLEDNPLTAARLANRSGYWYFVQTIQLADTLSPGQTTQIRLTWRNAGVAPSYHIFELVLTLSSGSDERHEVIPDSGNRRWRPDEDCVEDYPLSIPGDIPPGEYDLRIRLQERVGKIVRPVALGFQSAIETDDGSYRVARISIVQSEKPVPVLMIQI